MRSASAASRKAAISRIRRSFSKATENGSSKVSSVVPVGGHEAAGAARFEQQHTGRSAAVAEAADQHVPLDRGWE